MEKVRQASLNVFLNMRNPRDTAFYLFTFSADTFSSRHITSHHISQTAASHQDQHGTILHYLHLRTVPYRYDKVGNRRSRRTPQRGKSFEVKEGVWVCYWLV